MKVKELFWMAAALFLTPFTTKAQLSGVPHNDPPCTISIPYSTGFENDVSEQMPSCWTALMGETFAYDFFYYAHNGSKLLILNASTGESRAATPRIPLPLNRVSISFWCVDMALSGPGVFRVGYVTSLSNPVQWLDTIPSYYDYTLVSLDFSEYNITDTCYVVFSYNNTAGTGLTFIDDFSIQASTSCASVTNLHTTAVNPFDATVAWTEDASLPLGYWCYIADTNSFAAAWDSAYVVSGSPQHTFTGLDASTQYYVWVVADCGTDRATMVGTSFTTASECGEVLNLQAQSGNSVIGLSWDAPTTSSGISSYRVDYSPVGDTHWVSAYTSQPHYFINGLNADTRYQYRVTTWCTEGEGGSAGGEIYTLGCTAFLTDSTGPYNNLPMSFTGLSSYTQQIYLAADLTGVDTITGITFFLADDYNMDPAEVDLYLGNCSRIRFMSGSDYYPVGLMTQVFSDSVVNTGREVTIHFATPFVRVADSNLIVALLNNSGDIALTSPAFVCGTTTQYRSLYRTSALGTINPATPPTGQTTYRQNRIRLNTRGCTLPACERPMVIVDEVGTDYINISWNGDSAATYACAFRPVGASAWTVTDSAVSGSSYHFTCLQSGVTYEMKVTRVCGSDTLSGVGRATMPCDNIALPYGENFETSTLNERYSRPCWGTGSMTTGNLRLYPTVVTQGAGNRVCSITESYLVLPEVNQPLNQLQIRFDLRQTSDSDYVVLGYMQSINDSIITAVNIDTVYYFTAEAVARDTSVIIRFNNLPEVYGNLVIYAPRGCQNQYIDNIMLEEIPNCIPVESGNVNNITATSAQVEWGVPYGYEGATGYSYMVEYGPRFFEPGTGVRQESDSTSISLSGLAMGSNYDVYIYTLCSNDTATAYGPIRFSTMCGVVDSLPYIMDFEGINQGADIVQDLPSCWNWAWVQFPGTVQIVNTSNPSLASSGQYCLSLSNKSVVALPTMPVDLNQLKVQFHLYRDEPATTTIIVGAVDSLEAGFEVSFVGIDTLEYEENVYERQVTLYLSEYTGTSRNLALYVTNENRNNHYYIDDLVVDYIENCAEPRHMNVISRTDVSATIVWRNSNAASYTVEYGPQGFTPGSGTNTTTNTNSVTLVGLQPGTTYDMHITGHCGTDNSHATFSFTTLCGAPVTTYPYICTFADSTERNAWNRDNGEQVNGWYFGNDTYAGTDDNWAMYISNDQGATNQYRVNQATHAYAYRALTLNHSSYHIQFKCRVEGEMSYDFLRVCLVPARENFIPGYNPMHSKSTNPYFRNLPDGWIPLDIFGLVENPSWVTFNKDFTVDVPGNYYLLFYWLNDNSMGTQPPAAVDNIIVTMNGCDAPQELTASNVTTSSIELHWEENLNAQGVEIEYGLSGFERGTGTTVMATDTSYTFTGLDAETAYDFYARTKCGDSWYSYTETTLTGVTTLGDVYYTVTVLANNAAWGTVEGGGQYLEGSVATLTASPAVGYRFEGWDDGNSENPRMVTVQSDTTLTALFESTQGIDETSTGRIRLYPNPASDNLVVVSPIATEVLMIDVTGREVLRQQVPEGETILDVSQLAPGVYYVKTSGTPQKVVIK